MFVELLVITLGSFVCWIILKWRKTSNYWAEKNIPFSAPHPILGNLTFLQKENPAFWLRRLREQFKGPYVGIWLFWRPALVVQSPELARRVLVKDADNFKNRFLSSGKTDPIGGLNIFTANDPLWSTIRRRLTPVFTAAKLRSLEGLINSKVSDLVKRLEAEMKNKLIIKNIRQIFSDYTTDVIGEAAFGIKSESTITGDSIMRKVTRDFMHFSVYRGLSWASIFFFPELVDYFRFSLFPKATTAYLSQIYREMVEMRGGYEKSVQEPRDLLDALIKIKQDAAAGGEEISEEVMVAQAAIFVQGGFETAGLTLSWTALELAHHPHIQEKLYQELVEAKQKHNGDLDSAALADVHYLNAVIKETLRKYPPMGWIDRIASHDYQVDENLKVPAGTVVYVNAVGMTMDPDIYPDPQQYNPDRFMPENEHNITPYTFMPFGEGPRSCIGMRFAYITLRLALAAVCLQFRIEPVAGQLTPNEWPLENKGLLIAPEGPISLHLTEREIKT